MRHAFYSLRHLYIIVTASISLIDTFVFANLAAGAGTDDLQDMAESKGISAAITDFSLALYRACSRDKGVENVLLSPSNIATALAMTLAGARGNTASQILLGLGLDNLETPVVHQRFKELLSSLKRDDNSVTLVTANRLFIQKGMDILAEFTDILRLAYNTSCGEVDCVGNPQLAREAINKWVSEVTKEKINDLIPNGFISPSTRLIISSAVYFKGLWANKFSHLLNQVKPFHGSLHGEIGVDMMFQKKKFLFAENEELSCKALYMPYVGDDIGLLVLLPNAVDGLGSLENALNGSAFHRLLQSMREEKVSVWLPKFHMEDSFSLVDKLKTLGVHDLFDQGKADLSGITGSSDMYAGAALHKVMIEVNEEGTEAAAATAMRINKRCLILEEEFEFTADHPFLFAVVQREQSLILFLGALKNPTPHTATIQHEEL